MMTTQNSKTQKLIKKYPLEKDVLTIDGIINAFYEIVSGEAGKKRQWERDSSIHDPNAIYSYLDNVNGEFKQVTMSLKDFHKQTDAMIMETAFYESEINREMRLFGNIAHVWSTYETRLVKNGPVARRGINSIQLFFDKGKWNIVSLIFEREREEKIPKTFEPN